VERYINNQDGRFHRLYMAPAYWALSTAYSREKIKTIGRGENRTNYLLSWKSGLFRGRGSKPLDARRLGKLLADISAFASAIGLEFGAIDLAEDNYGRLYIIDVTGTPHWGDELAPDVLDHWRRAFV
jgi:hypothetical protein